MERVGETNRIIGHLEIRRCKGIAGPGMSQFWQDDDIAGNSHGDGNRFLPDQGQDFTHLFVFALGYVIEPVAFFEFARENADITELSGKGVDNGLKYESRKGFIGIYHDRFFRLLIGPHHDLLRSIGHVRNDTAQEFCRTDMVNCTAAHQRADAACQHPLIKALAELFDGEFIAVEVFFQQFIVAFRSGFHAHFAHFTSFRHVFRRNFNFRALSVIPFPGDHFADVDNSAEIFAFTDWDLQRHDGFSEYGAQFFQAAKKVGVFHVHLVDIDHARQFQFETVVPSPFRIHFDARFCRYDQQNAVTGSKGSANFTAKFRVPRRIEEIQFIAFPFAGCNTELNRYVTLNFFRFIIHNMLVVFTDANGIDGAAGQQ